MAKAVSKHKRQPHNCNSQQQQAKPPWTPSAPLYTSHIRRIFQPGTPIAGKPQRQLGIHSSLAAVVVQTCQAAGTVHSIEKRFLAARFNL